jgi:hypothetical protein
MQKNNYDIGNILSDSYDAKDYTGKSILGGHQHEFYKDADNKVEICVRVKKTVLPNKSERWRVFIDNKIVFILDGTKLSKKERNYLGTQNGFNFLIAQFKQEMKSFNKLRIALKKQIK